jgi:hypothetical protein
MTKRRKASADPARVVPAPPGSDPPLAWLLKMFERAGGKKTHAARVACNNLNDIVLNSISYALGFALRGKNSIAKRWAGELLASIFVSIQKHDEKLCKTNAAYLKEKKKLGKKLRTNVVLPKSPVVKVVQRELKKAKRYRERLLIFRRMLPRDVAFIIEDKKAIEERKRTEKPGALVRLSRDVLRTGEVNKSVPVAEYWKEVARRRRIPEEYFVTVELPDFSVKSEPQWWKFLWPLIRKKINVAKLESRYRMARKRYVSDSETTARDHLKLLARSRDAGI